MIGLVGLDEDFGILVSAAGAADDLGEELEGAFFGGEIGERETGVGLNDTKGGEFGEIETFGDHLSTDDDVSVALSDGVVGEGKRLVGCSVSVETRNFGAGENFLEFGFEEFGAETFVENVSLMAVGTAGGNGSFGATSVTEELEFVDVEIEREETVGAEGLPAAVVADGERGRAAAIVKDHGLGMVVEGFLDG